MTLHVTVEVKGNLELKEVSIKPNDWLSKFLWRFLSVHLVIR